MVSTETNTLSWIFIVLTHRNNNPQIDMSLHSDTLSRFWSNQSLLCVFYAVFLVEKQQIPILQFWVWPLTWTGFKPTTCNILREHTKKSLKIPQGKSESLYRRKTKCHRLREHTKYNATDVVSLILHLPIF